MKVTARKMPSTNVVSTDSPAKTNVQMKISMKGTTKRGSVTIAVKLENPTGTRQPGMRTSPSADSKLPVEFGR